MFGWFKRKIKEIRRSSKNGERLTEHETKLIFSNRHHLVCPDCIGDLLSGPEGGASMNCLCEKCGSEFNIDFLGGDRISDAGPRDPGDRKELYRGLARI